MSNESRFYRTKEIKTCFKTTTVNELNKNEFCKWVCEERNNVNDMQKFNNVIEIFDRFLNTTVVF